MTLHPYLSALEWHIDNGADGAWEDAPVNRTVLPQRTPVTIPTMDSRFPSSQSYGETSRGNDGIEQSVFRSPTPVTQQALSGSVAAKEEAIKLAKAASTLDELKAAIQSFNGIDIKKTATQIVFADGNPSAPIMLIGEAPGADEDRIGKPFVGASGQLLDRILACIDLDRTAEDATKAVYISNILNWRPPGNRTPTPAECEVSLPFIERHIQLVKPKLLIFCGGVSAKVLLGSGESISRLRGKFHDYKPLTAGLSEAAEPIPALATFHPSYLLRTPAQKRAVWQDMLILRQRMRDIHLI